jgi:hypothetical protein
MGWQMENDQIAACKSALQALSGHYGLLEWAQQMEIIRRNVPALIAEVEQARAGKADQKEP